MQNPVSKGPPPPPGSSQNRPLALRFISGKYQGGEFLLVPGKEIHIGRSNDLDMVLAEDMVSRKHARIAFQGDDIFIEDLASTNGTFVNGEKIKRSKLREGDRVLIGTSILKVVISESVRRTSEEQARRDMEIVAAHRRTSQVRSMSGSIEEIPLPDLLQLLGTSKKSGVLVIRTEEDVIGRIYMRKGLVYFASINDMDEIHPFKSVFRMLSWTNGLFDLEPPDERTFANPLDMPVQGVLMEGMRQMDELNQIKERLPRLTSRLHMAMPLQPALRDLKPQELDILQLVHNFGYFEQVLNQSPSSDLDTAQAILKLIDNGYLRVD
ncbi:MAG: FHA domain-containing protein FhaB [Deltaproteobacteria bacterium ADurb.Bin207]|nr:MAG: FHA domain-containing protein FhaB [Deltaproteobacteria bacterium ADurb.Bin207]